MEHSSDIEDDFRYEIEFANELIELDVYRLLTIIFSSKALRKADPPILGLDMMTWKFERAEIYRIVFNLAIRARNILDKPTKENKLIAEEITGKLELGTVNSDLSFREACNKIIHSEHINFGIVGFKSIAENEGITEFIYVYGKKGRKQWKAIIDLIKFSNVLMGLSI